jgi:intracellular sulfur oxidation DsrE/DsrF family protein
MMMKLFSAVLLITISPFMTVAQSGPKTILHLQSGDTVVHRSMVSQISNLKKSIPTVEIEILCHGPGLSIMLKSNPYIKRILDKNFSDVTFVGCEFTMSQRNIKKEDLIPTAVTVPFGITEIVTKQQEGWLYVKLGF